MLLKKTTPLIIYTLLIFSITNSFAQRTPYKNHKFVWENKFTIPDAVKEKFSNEDIVILEEETDYVVNQRTQPTNAITGSSRQRSSTIKRRIVAKILTQKGLQEFSKLVLPEPINHYTNDYDGLVSRQTSINNLKHYNTEVQYLEGRVLKPDGTQQRLTYTDEVVTQQMGLLGENHKAIEYHFTLKKLEVGSTVELAYELYSPVPLGYPIIEQFGNEINGFYTSAGFYYWWRFFFNSKYPVQKSKTTFAWFNELKLKWQFYNGSEPTDTINEVDLNKYVWEFEDLKGTSFNENEACYKELPNAYFYYHNLLYGDYNDNKLIDYKPYSWQFICQDVIQFEGDNEVLSSQFSLKERMLSQFYKEHKEESKLRTLRNMHHTLVNDFDYKNNKKFYFGTDIELYAPGKDLKNKKLHELNRFKVYDGLLRRLGLKYYLVFASDKNTAAIEKERPIVPINPVVFYAVEVEGVFVFLIPKHDKKGFYLDEIPHYLEGQTALLVAQNAESKFDNRNILFVDLPKSSTKENYRNVSGKVSVNLKNKTVKAETKLTLSGQYSSLLRNFYQQKSQVKSKFKRFYEWEKPVEIKENLPIEYEEAYPFKAEKLVKFEADNIITEKTDSLYEINITGWLQQTENQSFEQAIKRNYQLNFKMLDKYMYLIEFNQPVELLQTDGLEDLNYNEKADFGSYSVKAIQQSPTQIIIESKLTLKEDAVKSAETSVLKAIYKHIKRTNKKAVIIVRAL